MEQRHEKYIKRTARGKLLASVFSLGGVIFAEVIALIVVLLANVDSDSLWTMIIPEFFGAMAAVMLFVAIGGRTWATIRRDDITFTIGYGWWALAIAFTLMLFDISDYLYGTTSLSPHWVSLLLETFMLCLFIGVFEEFLFRGIIFHALLAVMGDAHKGLMRAVFITSLIFGCAHVSFDTDFASTLATTQAVLKIIQTGMFSVLLCTTTLRTRHIVGASLFHALDDFLLVVPGTVLRNEPLSTDYVFEGDEGMETIWIYLFVIALYLPFVVKSLRDLHRGHDATRGAYMEEVLARVAQERAAEAAGAYVAGGAWPQVPLASGMPSAYASAPGYGPTTPGVGAYGTPSAGMDSATLVPVQAPQTSPVLMEVPQPQEIVYPQPSASVTEYAPYQQQEVNQPIPQSSWRQAGAPGSVPQVAQPYVAQGSPQVQAGGMPQAARLETQPQQQVGSVNSAVLVPQAQQTQAQGPQVQEGAPHGPQAYGQPPYVPQPYVPQTNSLQPYASQPSAPQPYASQPYGQQPYAVQPRYPMPPRRSGRPPAPQGM